MPAVLPAKTRPQFQKIAGLRVVVAGDVLPDHSIRGDATRIPPEPRSHA